MPNPKRSLLRRALGAVIRLGGLGYLGYEGSGHHPRGLLH